VDAVPVSLALAQAAKESGWGTSRFAREGYALFGERCFETGCGMVPRARRKGLSHEVTRFDSPREAVASYVRNLNTHPDYAEFRQLRAKLRQAPSPHPGIDLAGSLTSYSERREAYVREIREMIRFNGLAGKGTGG
jgi:Bax protein